MPEEPLTVPPNALQTGGAAALWTVVARNERVNRDWQELIQSAAIQRGQMLRLPPFDTNASQAAADFSASRQKYAGAWEYEITAGDRVFYVPDPAVRKVTVYYAGSHPDPAPFPPE